MRWKTIIIILLLLLLAGAGYYYWQSQQQAKQTAAQGLFNRPVPVVATTVKQITFYPILEAQGTTRANEAVTLTAKVTEYVKKFTLMMVIL